jgi:hypothetical protein
LRIEHVQFYFRIMPVYTAMEVPAANRARGDLNQVNQSMRNGAPVTHSCPVTVGAVEPFSPTLGLKLTLNSASGVPATVLVKVWGLQCLRALFGRFDLTEEQFVAALDSDELGDMVSLIADDQVFIMRIRVSYWSFNGNWEGHVNHVTRAP